MRTTSLKARSMQLAAAIVNAGLLACSGDTDAATETNQGAGDTSMSGSSTGAGGGVPPTSSTGTTGGTNTVGGAGGVATSGGAGGSLSSGGAGGAAGSGGTAAGAAGNATTDAGGAPPDGDPDVTCMAFCASSAVRCIGPDLEVASASSITSATPNGCSLSAMLPFSGTVEVTLDCSSQQVCIDQGSGCVGSPGECYPVQLGDSGFSYFVPACVQGSLGCSPE